MTKRREEKLSNSHVATNNCPFVTKRQSKQSPKAEAARGSLDRIGVVRYLNRSQSAAGLCHVFRGVDAGCPRSRPFPTGTPTCLHCIVRKCSPQWLIGCQSLTYSLSAGTPSGPRGMSVSSLAGIVDWDCGTSCLLKSRIESLLINELRMCCGSCCGS